MNYIAYDIEVFAYDYIVVFKDMDKKTVLISHNTNKGIEDIVNHNILVSYNGYYYDDKILTAILNDWSPEQLKKLNDRIISGEKVNNVSPKIKSLDCFQQIDVARPSLKKIEGNFGKSIVESKVPFDIQRPLTDDEVEETIFYCSYDVDTTIDVFKIRQKSYFEPKEMLVNMLPENKRDFARKWNTTTIGANVLTDKMTRKWADIRLGKTREGDGGIVWELFDIPPKESINLWTNKSKGKYTHREFGCGIVWELFDIPPKESINLWTNKSKGKYTHREFGCGIEFGFGGLHGVPTNNAKRYENVKLLDVASLYPNIIINLQALGTSTALYKEIVDKRLSVKHSDKQLSDALKLIINSCYGLLNNEYSMIYNPNAAKSVCIFGQIVLYDLCKRLSATCKLININTDGVGFVTESDDYKRVWKEWEQDYNLTLELETFDLWIQKDVNNYIGVKDGKIEVKGGDVGKYHKDVWFRNNNLRIVDIAVVEFLVNGTDVLTTIQDNMNNPRLFQIVLQAGNTYLGTFDQNGKQYNKINRVFPVKKNGVTLYKKRLDGGLVRFPDAPDNMLVWNDDVELLTDFRKKIDINFYYTLINKVIERWV